jgi:hypothetical protein
VDEFQDFSTLDLQLLRRIVPLDQPDSLFLAGDTVQRILVKRLTLSDAGFDTGAAAHHRIRKNYRNSRQIQLPALRGSTEPENGSSVSVYFESAALTVGCRSPPGWFPVFQREHDHPGPDPGKSQECKPSPILREWSALVALQIEYNLIERLGFADDW